MSLVSCVGGSTSFPSLIYAGTLITHFYRMFDHWAHLGGATFGALYYKYGTHLWNDMRSSYTKYDAQRAQEKAMKK